jgi:uncharacterized membrane protein
MKRITFKLNASQRIYNDYMDRVERCTTVLSKDDRIEMIMEINSHIYEGISRCNNENEVDVLLDITNKLGVPEEFLKPMVAKKKLTRAVNSFNPIDVFQAIYLNLKNGIIYSIFGILYLFLFSFAIIIIAKIIFPENTGLFYNKGSFSGFGFISETNGLNETLGYWIIPLSGLTALFLYFVITLLLRITRKQ